MIRADKLPTTYFGTWTYEVLVDGEEYWRKTISIYIAFGTILFVPFTLSTS